MTNARITACKTLTMLRKIRDELGPSPDGALERDIARAERMLCAEPEKKRPRFAWGFGLAGLASIVVLGISTDTEARRRVRAVEQEPSCVSGASGALCGGGVSIFGTPYQPIFEPLMPKLPRTAVRKKASAKAAPTKGTIAAYKRELGRGKAKGVSLRGVVGTLARKAEQISAKCGSRVVSAVAGRPNRSNHPIGRAVDMQGNPKCMYAMLKGWPGGVSYDYAAVNHVHISYNPGGMEWGVRFAHRGYRTRLAGRYR